MRTIDINCDLGESYGRSMAMAEAGIYPWISSCNIACGFHSGDPLSIEDAFLRAQAHHVAAGAHPSFPDLMGFGRTMMTMSVRELGACLRYQIAAAAGIAASLGTALTHVKPHGALYHLLWTDDNSARLFVDVVGQFDGHLRIYGPPDSAVFEACRAAGLPYRAEAFADRQYEDDLTLRPRSHPNAVLDTEAAVAQALELACRGRVKTASGTWVPLQADTLCIHGDQPGAAQLAKRMHQQLTENEVEIAFH